MENVAHALAGLLVAKGVVALRERREGAAPSPRFAAHAAWVSAIANNVADGDLVLVPLTGGKLGYLLHHRGHTHTLLVGVALGLVVAMAALALWRRRPGEAATPVDRLWLLALGALGPVVHLGMDGWNTYGIHPFWPVDDRWVYGDAVFIVEPLLWLAAVPVLFRDARSRLARVLLGLLGALGLALPWVVPGFVPLENRLALLVFGAAMAALAWRLPARGRVVASLLAFVAVPAVFLGAGVAARGVVARTTVAAFSGETVVDVASTAWPSNPLCWSAIAMTTSAGGDLVLRRASVALAPSLLPLSRCPRSEGTTTAPMLPVAPAPPAPPVEVAPAPPVEVPPAPPVEDRVLRWEGETRTPLARLRQLGERCDVAAAMRFIRAPFVVERRNDGESGFVVGDLRFDRDARLDFAEIALPSEVPTCPRNVPSWEPPRARELAPERSPTGAPR